MNKTANSIALVCDKNPCTSFGRLVSDLYKVLSPHYKTDIVWLTTPRYFPPEMKLPEGSHTINAKTIELGWWTFRSPLHRWLKENQPSRVLFLRPELGFLVPLVHRSLPKSWAGVLVADMFAETLYPHSLKYNLINRFFISPTRFADGFIYISEYTRNEAHRVMGLNRKDPVVGCPVDTARFISQRDKQVSFKKRWGFDKYEGMCLNVSLDEPRKNIPTFFKIAKARPQLAFVRVGPFSPWMQKWLKENSVSNVFHYYGLAIDKLVELFACADLFIYPSFLEGFGMPPIEALACGVPVAAASTSALKENLEGVTPLVYPPDNVEGYIEIVDRVQKGENVVDWDRGRSLIKKFTLDSFGERVRCYFKSLSDTQIRK